MSIGAKKPNKHKEQMNLSGVHSSVEEKQLKCLSESIIVHAKCYERNDRLKILN
jgi:hypothetical protein